MTTNKELPDQLASTAAASESGTVDVGGFYIIFFVRENKFFVVVTNSPRGLPSSSHLLNLGDKVKTRHMGMRGFVDVEIHHGSTPVPPSKLGKLTAIVGGHERPLNY